MLPPYLLYEFAKRRYEELLYGVPKVKSCQPQRAMKLCQWNKETSAKGTQKLTAQNSVLLNEGRPWMKKT